MHASQPSTRRAEPTWEQLDKAERIANQHMIMDKILRRVLFPLLVLPPLLAGLLHIVMPEQATLLMAMILPKAIVQAGWEPGVMTLVATITTVGTLVIISVANYVLMAYRIRWTLRGKIYG